MHNSVAAESLEATKFKLCNVAESMWLVNLELCG